jgi:hypothetical protein
MTGRWRSDSRGFAWILRGPPTIAANLSAEGLTAGGPAEGSQSGSVA